MNYCSIPQSQLGSVIIEYVNGDDDDYGQGDDHDIYHDHVHKNDDQDDDFDFMTRNLCQGYGNNCEFDHLQDVEIVDVSKGVDRDGDYDNDDNGIGHIDQEGP